MSKAVLISIQPKWCELIVNGKKTIEVRKTRPKIAIPFKCYIYCTLGDCGKVDIGKRGNCYNGKVIGEFVCDYITPFRPRALVCDSEMCKLSQVPVGKLVEYAPDKPFPDDHIYGWHISDLVIYDRPKELSEFCTTDNAAVRECEHRFCGGQPEYKTNHGGWIKGSYMCTKKSDYDPDWCEKCKTKPITRPPQSWCYVEEMKDS